MSASPSGAVTNGDHFADLARRYDDETLARLLRQHQEAEDKAHDLWCMHMGITTAILAEQNRRIGSG